MINTALKIEELSMAPTEDNQKARYNDQCPSNNCQVNIGFHNLFPPLYNEVNYEQKYTANKSGKKDGINDIPLNHNFTSLIKSSDMIPKATVITNEVPDASNRFCTFCGTTKSGEITPMENQATAILPKISESLLSWLSENLITKKAYHGGIEHVNNT